MLRALKEIIKKISDTKLGILGIYLLYFVFIIILSKIVLHYMLKKVQNTLQNICFKDELDVYYIIIVYIINHITLIIVKKV